MIPGRLPLSPVRLMIGMGGRVALGQAGLVVNIDAIVAARNVKAC